jgi:hypothetical protein
MTGTLSCNHFWIEKAVSITYSEYVLVALGMQHAIRMRHIVSYGLPGCIVFFQLSLKQPDFRKKRIYLK